MRDIRKRIFVAALAIPAAAALLAFFGGLVLSSPGAQANHGLSVGLDFDVAGTPANGAYNPASLPQFETCGEVLVGGQISIDFFILDVDNLIAFEADIQFDGQLVEVTSTNTLLFMDSQGGSNITNLSQPTPDSDGLYETAAVEVGNTLGDTGYGVLSRVTFTGLSAGIADISLPNIDFDSDGDFDTGVFLRDASLNALNDADSDGWYDGPYTNRQGTIVVGQDFDGDGIPSPACPGSPVDNCPNDPGSQADLDGDGLGDVCDPDIDGDHWFNQHETDMGSNPTDANSIPEVCDGLDNDGDGSIDEGYDLNTNSVPDCSDPAADTDNDGTANPTDLDDDADGWNDTVEINTGMNSLIPCPTGSGHELYAWVPDTNNDGLVSISDVLRFAPHFLAIKGNAASDHRYNFRYDYNGDGKITIGDVLSIAPDFLTFC